MKKIYLVQFLIFITIFSNAQVIESANKKWAVDFIEKESMQLIKISDNIGKYAELAMQEYKSSQELANYCEQHGFKLKKGVADIPTAFIAEYGTGKPIIAVMGEFDALPGLSQKNVPYKEELEKNGNGHGCGHNMFGAGSVGAAVTIKKLIENGKLKGTIRFYATPAEEDKAGKVYMARAGLFNDVDICLDWHPDAKIAANMQSSQAVIDYDFNFIGKSAHAAADPWLGRSALDAAELFNIGVNFLREHTKPSVRIHYVYKDAGKVPNVIPNTASVWLWIRDSKRAGVADVEKRVLDIAKGAALMAGVKYEVKLNNGLYEILINETGAKTLQKNLELLGNISYSQEELNFAEKLMKEFGDKYNGIDGNIHPLLTTKEDPDGGSTDVGDISYIVPEISLTVTTAPALAPWHSWVVVSCGGMSIGHKGMIYAAKALALTMIDLFENNTLVDQMKKEFKERKGNEVWKAIIPDGLPPVPPVNK